MQYVFAYHKRGPGKSGLNQGRVRSFRAGRTSGVIVELVKAESAEEAVATIDKRLGEILLSTEGGRVWLDWAIAVAHNLDLTKLEPWVDKYDRSPLKTVSEQ